MNPVMPQGFVGSDTYPILLTSRYDSPATMWEMMGSRLMPGFFPVDFYRPVAGMIWGACYNWWGLDASGYLGLNQLIHMLNALLLVPISIALFGARGRRIGLAGAALFALYPLSVDNVPVVARMPDLLVGTLIMVTLLLHGAGSRWKAAPIISPVVALLAFGVKEAAFVIPALVLAFDFCRLGNWRKSIIRAAPHTAALALFLLLRAGVLGGIGGYDAGDVPIVRAAGTLVEYVRTLFLPFGLLETYRYGGGLLPFLGRLGAGLLVAFLWQRNDPTAAANRDRSRAALFLGIWIGVVVLLHLPVRRFERRYVYLASLPSSLLLSWLMLAGPRGVFRRIGAAAAAFLVVWQLSFTPLFGGYQEWKIGDRLAREYLESLDPQLLESGDESLVLTDCPWKVVARPRSVPRVDQAFILSERSIRGYAMLRHPGFQGEITVLPRKVYVDPDGNTTF